MSYILVTHHTTISHYHFLSKKNRLPLLKIPHSFYFETSVIPLFRYLLRSFSTATALEQASLGPAVQHGFARAAPRLWRAYCARPTSHRRTVCGAAARAEARASHPPHPKPRSRAPAGGAEPTYAASAAARAALATATALPAAQTLTTAILPADRRHRAHAGALPAARAEPAN